VGMALGGVGVLIDSHKALRTLLRRVDDAWTYGNRQEVAEVMVDVRAALGR
jgi:hypothetical protein